MRHLLTGAGSGIGLVLARRLAERGDELVLLARSEERAAQMRTDLPHASYVVADLADPGTINGLGRQVDVAGVQGLVVGADVVEVAQGVDSDRSGGRLALQP